MVLEQNDHDHWTAVIETLSILGFWLVNTKKTYPYCVWKGQIVSLLKSKSTYKC